MKGAAIGLIRPFRKGPTLRIAKRLGAAIKRRIAPDDGLRIEIDRLKINQGVLLGEMHRGKESRCLKDFEFRVFSQWGEDGIIQHLINTIDINEHTFIEFGVEDFSESNCRFLLMKDNWSGFVIDGSTENIRNLRSSYYYWMHDLNSVDSFITKENINHLLSKSGFSNDLGILSIDLDGNDYHILEAIEGFTPRILICEYNALFGPTRSISVPYDPAFVRGGAHYSHVYYGASLGAMKHVAERKGYALVGTNSAGTNAFFARNDLLNDKIAVQSLAGAYSMYKLRESRDREGNLTYLGGDQSIQSIRGLPVINVETGEMESL